MRTLLAALVAAPLLALVLAGCGGKPVALVQCDGDLHPVRLYLGPDLSLQDDVPGPGAVPGNSFAGAFATNDLDEWLSATMLDPLHLEGEVALTLFIESKGTPAPIPQGDAGNGYQLFNQFGSDRTLQPGYATENAPAVLSPGTQLRFVERIPLPPGGFELEAGDRVRLLLTSLALDSPSGSGHDILFGNPHASRIDFLARCAPRVEYAPLDHRVHDVQLLGNQGLFTGQVPASEHNTVTIPLALAPETARLSIDLGQGGSDPVPAKDDIDLEIVSGSGEALWSIGSPYSDEHGVLWAENLAWLRGQGASGVRVNSYSGVAYEGTLTITQERALAA